jgi:hypothetical protein
MFKEEIMLEQLEAQAVVIRLILMGGFTALIGIWFLVLIYALIRDSRRGKNIWKI